MKGLYGKYIVSKANGNEIDLEAKYIILRIDSGEYVDACRKGVLAFAKAVEPLNPDLARDLNEEIIGCVASENPRNFF